MIQNLKCDNIASTLFLLNTYNFRERLYTIDKIARTLYLEIDETREKKWRTGREFNSLITRVIRVVLSLKETLSLRGERAREIRFVSRERIVRRSYDSTTADVIDRKSRDQAPHRGPLALAELVERQTQQQFATEGAGPSANRPRAKFPNARIFERFCRVHLRQVHPLQPHGQVRSGAVAVPRVSSKTKLLHVLHPVENPRRQRGQIIRLQLSGHLGSLVDNRSFIDFSFLFFFLD